VSAYLEDLQVRNYSLSTIHGRRLVLTLVFRFLRSKDVADVRRVREEHLTSFAAYLRKHESFRFRVPLAVATQRFYLGTIRGFFGFLEGRGVILRSPAADLQQPKAQRLPRGVLNQPQARKLMAAPDPWTAHGVRDRAMLEVFYGCGLRLSECLNLALPDVDLAQGLLLVRNGKGKKDRMLPIGASAEAALRKYLDDARPLLVRDPRVNYVFLSERGRRMSQTTLSDAMAAHGREAGIPWRVSPHILRHTFATHLIQNGADVRHVQQLLGHAEIDTTAIYTRVAVKDLRGVVESKHPRDRFEMPDEPAEEAPRRRPGRTRLIKRKAKTGPGSRRSRRAKS
jgi:integrase/recombinase XerD